MFIPTARTRRAAAVKARHNGYGVAKIKRDSYSNDAGDWWSWVRLVNKRSGGRCEGTHFDGSRCRNRGRHVHHIIPLNRGGLTRLSNLIHLCLGCHESRHNHMKRKRK